MNVRTRMHAMLAVLICLLGGLVTVVVAQVSEAVPPVASNDVISMVSTLASRHPWVTTVLMVVGWCRIIVKPMFSFLHEVVKVTPSERDDVWLAKVESSRIYKALVWALDWLFSVKLIHPKTGA